MTNFTNEQLEAWASLGPWDVTKSAWDERHYVEGENTICHMYALREDDHAILLCDDHETNAALIAAAPDLARLVLEKEKEIARLKAKLSQTPTAEWFYNPDDWEYSYESPRHVIDCMDLPDGNHVIRVDAAAVKPIYCAVKIATNDPDAPWPYTLTEHETEDEARQAMKETSDE